jgi:hypothetical protein
MRTTLTIEDSAYRLAQAVAQQKNQTVGKVLGDAIMERFGNPTPESSGIVLDGDGFPTFRVGRPITPRDVQELIEED